MQHNCFDGQCQTYLSSNEAGRRQEDIILSHRMNHRNTNSYLLNGFSHHFPQEHHKLSNFVIEPISSTKMIEASEHGLNVWLSEKEKHKDPDSISATGSNHILT